MGQFYIAGDTGCDTEKFVADVNAAGFCGAGDWRLPSKEELFGIVILQGPPVGVIDKDYFPNTLDALYWSSTVYWTSSAVQGRAKDYAIQVSFDPEDLFSLRGHAFGLSMKSDASPVRLVRGDR